VLLGVLLAGIVAMQVEMLKLNSSIGRSIQLGTALQSRNELLRANVSALSDAQRIERLATRMGMVMPGPTSINFLDANRIDAAKAAGSIHSPDAAGFASLLQASGAGQITPLGSSGTGALAASPTVTAPGAPGAATATSAAGTTAAATGAIGGASTTGATGTGATGPGGTGTSAGPGSGTSTGTATGVPGGATGATGTTAGTGGATTGGTGLQSSHP
jgi:hypothetical protein